LNQEKLRSEKGNNIPKNTFGLKFGRF